MKEAGAGRLYVRAGVLMHVCGCVLLTRWTAASSCVSLGDIRRSGQARHVHSLLAPASPWPALSAPTSLAANSKQRLDMLRLSRFKSGSMDDPAVRPRSVRLIRWHYMPAFSFEATEAKLLHALEVQEADRARRLSRPGGRRRRIPAINLKSNQLSLSG